ncbi:hypothetical protein A1O1_07004 [Capronia coronata CBS 617.96]|uniref:Xylanolytic transcriptional activator regulatory domain-containing protein n=1 Tax=Capronia coronata CBS 617.96 TaxID=1182541 RepID=W9XS75_9EURO|nr:uncharacterized protein A1O1_07004 [Capronia coronata CBS 617.96]EXJ83382.1 hypothetical protein A1O1_07004 [Capronia coronata CBS 617.96]
MATFEAFPQSDAMPELEAKLDDDYHIQDTLKFDRTVLTPSVVRYLLGQYDRCIRPQYDIPIPELSNQDATLLKKLPDHPKFKILIACAIAAARESYRSPQWKAMSQLCRDWANESINTIISSWDGESLTAILLLLIYELADSSRGVAWELLDLAIRTCLQLGWHRTNGTLESGPVVYDSSDSSNKARLMSVLKSIEG